MQEKVMAPGAGHEPMPRLRRSSAINLSDADAGLLLRFSADVKQVAISCASLMSWLNAVDGSKSVSLPVGMAAFKPLRVFDAFVAVSGSPIAALLTPAVVVGLRGLAHFLASSATICDELEASTRSNEVPAHTDTARARDALYSVACFTKMTLKDLVAIHERLFREFDVAELSYLSALLDDVIQGQSPLFADEGFVPVRTNFTIRDVRVAMHADAVVAQTDIAKRVIVRNISQGGLGFEAAGAIETGQIVTIRLSTSGRQFNGRIVWKVGQRAGVEFFERLEDGDDLFI